MVKFHQIMQKKVYFFLNLASIVLFACQAPVTFKEPQPKDVASLGGFPQRMQGKYLSSEDNTLLRVTSNSMIRIYDFDQKLHLSQLDSNLQIIGDTLFDLRTNTGQVISVEGDSLTMHIHEQDTLFKIDDLNVLKKFKGYYFMNIYVPTDTWKVQELEFSQGRLILSSINPKKDLAQLKVLTESTQDTAPYIFSPTRKQFKQFVRNEGFRDREVFWEIGE
jgi:hypothetical protein